METKANFTLIGAVVIGAVAAAMAFAVWIAGADFRRSFAEYTMVFQGPVRGLAEGGEVRFQGIKVGEVTDLRIDPDNAAQVLARVRIDAATQVRADSFGQLEPIGITGVNLIQILGGTNDAPILRQVIGQPPPRIRGEASDIDKLLGAGGDIAQQTSQALMRIQGLLTEENVAHVSGILADVNSVTKELAAQKALIGDARATVQSLRKASEAFVTAAAEIEGLAGDTRSRLDDVSVAVKQAGDAAGALQKAAQAGEGTLRRAEDATAILAEQSLPDIALAAQDLRRLSTTMDGLAASLERNPNQLVVGAERPIVKVKP